jgi:hypothetical protein
MTWNLFLTGLVVVVLTSAVAYMMNPSTGEPSPATASEDEQTESQVIEPTPETVPDSNETANTSAPEDASPRNRADCREIRGDDYLSGAERTWFLANCVSR